MSTNTQPAAERELRYALTEIQDFNFRDATQTGDGSWLIEGYAAVFDQKTTLYDGRFYRLEESIAPGAFRDVLARVNLTDVADRTLVHLNYVHDMQSAVASTDADGPIGRLLLAEDDYGLRFTARIDRDDPDAVRMASKMRRGVVRQASFAFTIDREESYSTEDDTGRETEHARVLAVKDLYDVCVCPQGAYPQTSSILRSLAAAIGRSPDDGEGQLHRPDGGASTIATSDEAGVVAAADDFARRKAALQAHAASRRVKTRHTKRK